jgi:hypothetical protein
MVSHKSIRNINSKQPHKNNNSDLPDFEFKTDVKVKGFNSNIIFNKSEYNLINIKKIIIIIEYLIIKIIKKYQK